MRDLHERLRTAGYRGLPLDQIDPAEADRLVRAKLARRMHGPGPSRLVATVRGKADLAAPETLETRVLTRDPMF